MIEYHPKLDPETMEPIPGVLELGILGNIREACGQGFARTLMELLEYDAVRRQCYTLSLQTHVYNVGAQKFYKHMKFAKAKSEIAIEKEANANFCKTGDHAIFQFYKEMWPKLIVDTTGGCKCFRAVTMTKDLEKPKEPN